ncbi:MAG: hypothetical protein MI924_17230 [Chloroflexales bacterium]|nr:hypothetical protein [Chloroflexales bacterium]
MEQTIIGNQRDMVRHASQELVMSDFCVRFIGNECEDGEMMMSGEIRIGAFAESFQSSLHYWRTHDYVKQWRDGLSRLLVDHKHSCIVTSMYHPSSANFIFWWLFYLDKNIVHIQNHVLLLNDLDESFSIDNLYHYIPQRDLFDEDRNKISEWDVQLEQIQAFYDDWLKSEEPLGI